VILLGDDLRLFRSQLEPALEEHANRSRLLGRLDDLQALVVAVDGDLRRIAAFVQSPFMPAAPFADALASLADEFAARTGIEPETRLRGDFTNLTDSQQITLLSLIREALSNVREHSEAEHVAISLSSDRRGVKATVTDDKLTAAASTPRRRWCAPPVKGIWALSECTNACACSTDAHRSRAVPEDRPWWR
jgi:signal transduction histidine kinase